MTHVSVQDLQKNIQDIVQRVRGGEEMVLEVEGVPTVRLSAVSSPATESNQSLRASGFGFLRGQVCIPDDIDTPFAADIEEMFYGNPDKFTPTPE